MHKPFIAYKTRLKADLDTWHQKGWVSDSGREGILNELNQPNRSLDLANLFGLLGAITLCVAAMTFISANWQGMSNLARVLILFAAVWGAYGLSFVLYIKQLPGFANCAALLGCGLFGASIMLLGQIYHINGNPPDAVLIWALGTILAAVLLRSSIIGGLAFALLTLWSCMHGEMLHPYSVHTGFDLGKIHWPFMLLWLGLVVTSHWQKWYGGRHLAGLSMSVWLIFYSIILAPLSMVYLGLTLAVLVLSIAMQFKPPAGWLANIYWHSIFSYAAILSSVLVLIAQAHFAPVAIIVYLLVIGGAIALIVAARRVTSRIVAVVGYGLFACELLYIYQNTIGTLIGTAGFFAGAGIMLICFAAIAFKLERKFAAGGTS